MNLKPILMIVAVLAAGICAAQAPPAPLALERTIPLPGVKGRLDHLAIDVAARRLYVAARDNNSVEVVDLKAGKRIASIKGPKKPQGIAVIPDTHAILVASAEDGEFRMYNASLKLVHSLLHLDDADNVRYDADNKVAYVAYGTGSLAVIDPHGLVKTRDIRLPGHPESFELERGGNRIFVNVPTAKLIAIVAQDSGAVLDEWILKDVRSNYPMALDEFKHRLFVGFRKPAKLLVFDTESGKPVASVDCCGDVDDVFFDAVRQRVYASGGDGHVTVVARSDADHYAVLCNIPTSPGARTSYFDPAMARLYVAAPARDSQPAEILVYKALP